MYIAFIMLFLDVILYNLVIMHIPQKKYYKINHFHNYLLNYNGSEDISNYTNIINELDRKLENCSRINQAILVFSIILLIISIAIIFYIIIFICHSRESQMIKLSNFKDTINIINAIRLDLSIIDWSMALAIIAKINKIRKKEDKIGLTDEIKSGIIKVIIILTFYLMYCIFEVYFICCKVNENSLFLYNKYYINNKLKVLNIDEDEKSSEKKLLELLKELKDQNNQKDEKIKRLEEANNIQNEEINLLKSENKKQNIKIKELESENPYKLKENEKLLTIIFNSSDQKIHYSLICKNTQKFELVEQELYKIYPEYKETKNIFLLNGEKINRNKTIEENNIKFSDKIMVNKFK